MTDWIVTPQYFETPEPRLLAAAPEGAAPNGPHPIAARDAEGMATLHHPVAAFVSARAGAGAETGTGSVPVSLAGDCCAAVPALAGLQRAGIDPVVVWIDAHGDFNTPETSPSQFLGGMPLAMMAGRGPQWMMEAVEARPLAEERIVLVDGRDLDPLEAEAVAGSAMRHIPVAGLGALRLDAPVLLHIDMDVLDARWAPAFNYPVEGGPSAGELSDALAAFAAANRVACVSISAWSPSRDPDGTTARACIAALAPVAPGMRQP